MNEPTPSAGGQPPQVSVQLDSRSDAPDAPVQMETPKRRGAGIAIGAIVVLAGLLLWFANQGAGETAARTPVEEITAPVTIPDVAAIDELPATSADVIELASDPIDPHRIQTIAPTDDGWLATAAGSESVLFSDDDGRTWQADTERGDLRVDIRALGQAGGETVALATPNFGEEDLADLLETWTHGPDGWQRRTDRPAIAIESGRVTRMLVGETSLVVVEDRWQKPVPEVTEVLAKFVPLSIASQTCAMNRIVIDNAGSDYELVSCEGESIGLIPASAIEVGSKDDDLLAFTQEVLRTRTVIYMAIPGREQQVVELPPSQLILDIELTNEGFVAFILDSSEVLSNVEILYSQSFAALLIRWEAGDGPVTPFPTPVQTPVRASAWSLNEVVASPDGSLTVISPIGLHQSEPPFDSWTLLSSGPIDPPLPGRIASSALFGGGFFMPDPRHEDFFYASNDGETWTAFEHDGANLRRMLIATDDFFTFDTVDRSIVRVERG